MPIASQELAVQRKLTKWYVDADSFECVLVRKVKVPTDAGGYVTTPVPQPAQTLRMNPEQDGMMERVTADGRAVRPSYMLVGKYDAIIERYDTFFKDGREYQVVFVLENQQYQVKAEVAYVG